MNNVNIEAITDRVRYLLEDLGMRLYDLHYNHVSKTLRVFIDREKGGITIKDCQKVSKILSRDLDNTDLFSSSYTLEVSSPGIERYLKRPEHYAWAAGKHVEIDVGDKKITGFIRGIEKSGVVIATNSGEELIPFNRIVKARVVEEISYGKRR